MLDKSYWNKRYLEAETGWDTEIATPPIASFFEKILDKSAKILIPGCGRGHEAAFLQAQGFTNVTVNDISNLSIEQMLKLYPRLNDFIILNEDFFNLEGNYDFIIEQTFFCALDVSLRKKYVEKVSELLNEKGKIIGVLFNKEFEKQGPPFGGTKAEYLQLFNPYFNIAKLEPCYNSISPRLGNEFFIHLEKKKNENQ